MISHGINAKEVHIVAQTTGDILKNGFPSRYIDYKGSHIAYINEANGRFILRDPSGIDQYYDPVDVWEVVQAL